MVNGQYRRFVDEGGYDARGYWSDEGWQWKEDQTRPWLWDAPTYNRPSAPVVGITFYEACAYAAWAGDRLPSEEEWVRAARGDMDGRKYPWGDDFDKKKANTEESGLNQPTPVCAYPDGVSPHGCYDMAGNVWEWTDSLYDEDEDEDEDEGEDRRVMRGGRYFFEAEVSGCSSRSGNLHALRVVDVGFRLSRTP